MPPPPATDPSKPPYNSFVRFSGFAFQLLAGVGLASWLGYRLDRYLELEFPVFLLLFMLLMLGGMLYQAYRRLNSE
jgi:apolipoprotein N-acyltransferase